MEDLPQSSEIFVLFVKFYLPKNNLLIFIITIGTGIGLRNGTYELLDIPDFFVEFQQTIRGRAFSSDGYAFFVLGRECDGLITDDGLIYLMKAKSQLFGDFAI